MTAQSKKFRTRLTRSRQVQLKDLYDFALSNAQDAHLIIGTLNLLNLPTDFLSAVITDDDDSNELEELEEAVALGLEVDEVNLHEDEVDELDAPFTCNRKDCTERFEDTFGLQEHLELDHKLSTSYSKELIRKWHPAN